MLRFKIQPLFSICNSELKDEGFSLKILAGVNVEQAYVTL